MRSKLTLPFVGLLVAGCLGTEVGNPPFEPAPEEEPGFDPGDATVVPNPGMVMQDPYFFVFEPGGLATTVGEVHITPLDTMGDVVVAVPDGEGGLRAGLEVEVGQEIRVQLVADGVRGGAVDFLIVSDDELSRVTRAYGDCLEFEDRELLLGASYGASLRLRNACSDMLAFAPPRFRVDGGPFSVVEAPPDELAPGEIVTLAVQGDADPGDTEGVVFLEITGPMAERFPVTVRK
jgi:hypothetical protein